MTAVIRPRSLKCPLWQLIRASTAEPIYFPPEVIVIDGRQFIFVDGGVTVYNNLAFQMFLMATVDRYWINAPRTCGDGRRVRTRC
jgi:patatin-like phospholipase/acyl hydrolase